MYKIPLDPYVVVRQFEAELGIYTGASYVVTVDSCTNALFLSLKWHLNYKFHNRYITIPNKTYVSVPMQILHAGFLVELLPVRWKGFYYLQPYPIIDSAKHLTSGMYIPNTMMCLSFHWQKHLGIGRGGAILTDDFQAYQWFKKARFDGRTEGVPPTDDQVILGWHMYMTPEQAAAGLIRMKFLPKDNPDLPMDDYPDLSKMEIFK